MYFKKIKKQSEKNVTFIIMLALNIYFRNDEVNS